MASSPTDQRLGRERGTAERRAAAHDAAAGRLTAALEFRPWLEAIANISAAVNNMEPLGNVLNAIAGTTCGLLGYDFGAVLLADNDRLYMRGAYGLAATYIDSINSERPIRVGHGSYGEGPSSRAFRSHKPVVVRDYRDDPSVGPWAGVAIEQGYRSLAAIPLVVSGRAIGTLNTYTKEVHDFRPEELLLLQTISNQAALAIETARLREHERATIARLESVGRSLEEQAAMLERSEAIHSQLMRAVLDDSGLPQLAEVLTRVLSGSVVIDDGRGVPLAAVAHGRIAAELPAAALNDQAFCARLETQLGGRVPFELTASDHASIATRTFVAPVIIERELAGRLWVLGAQQPLDALERRALEHGATVVALELLKRRIAAEVEDRLAGELLGDLLGDRPPDPNTAAVRAQHLGHDLSRPQAAVVMRLDAVAPEAHELPTGRNRQLLGLAGLLLRRQHISALAGEIDGQVVLLVADAAGRGEAALTEIADAIRREVRAYMTGSTASVAVGPISSDVTAFGRSYRVARGALELSQRFGRPDRTVSASSLGVHGLLLSVDRLDELVRFSRDTLRPLRTYDERRNSELVATLSAFLAHGCRPGETAEALVVHPNTVAYRIRRIESLVNVDLGTPQAQVQIMLALIVDDIVSGERTPSL